MNLIAQIEAEQIAALGKVIPDFKAGDTVKVGYKVTEGTRSRVQNYEGVVIGRKGGEADIFGTLLWSTEQIAEQTKFSVAAKERRLGETCGRRRGGEHSTVAYQITIFGGLRRGEWG